MKNTDVYRKAIETFGLKNQIYMLMEECAELIQASNKVIRKNNNYESLYNLAEEIADVEIMIGQIKEEMKNVKLMTIKIKKEKVKKLQKLLDTVRGKSK